MTPTRANPYVGPRSFEQNETLYGRSRELRMLSAQLISERVVLLHSPSGAGKTSLIQAGLVPLLREEKFHILPVARVNLEPDAEAAARPGFNRYVYSAIAALEEGLPPEQRRPLAALASLTLDAYLTERPRPADAPRSDLLLFDQFEEILTIAPTDREGKQAFFAQLGAALRNTTRWALFAMREDYLGAIAPYVRPLPNRFEATFRLDLLGVDAALQAIQSPAQGAGVEFSDEAARKLADDLRRVQVQLPDGTVESVLGEHIEPVQLQVVCYRLWQSLNDEDTRIGLDDIAAIGDVDQSLADYYALSVTNAAQQTGLNERALREWFETKLITKEGIRGQVLMGAEASDGLDNRAVRLLENAHIIRAEKRAGATWFELSHDRLIQPVRKNNAEWFTQNLSLFQRQATLWNQQGRSEGLLLRGKEFQQAEKEAQALELTPDETAFLAACRKLHQHEQRERRRNTFMTILAIGATIAMIVAGVFYFQAQSSSAENAKLAKDNANVAATAQAASDQAKAAEAQAKTAEQQAVDAQALTEKTLKETEIELRKARNQQLSAQAELLQNTKPSLATLLALEAMKINQDANEPVSTVSYQALRNSLNYLGGSTLFNDTSRDASALAFSPDGRWFVVGHQDGSLAFWDMNDKSAAPLIEQKHGQPVSQILFASTGLAITAAGGEIGLWQVNETEAPKYLETFKTDFASIIDLALASTGTWFSASDRAKVILVPVTDGKAGKALPINNAKLGAFSPDGRWFALAGFEPKSEFTIQNQAALNAGQEKINFIKLLDLSKKEPGDNPATIDSGASFLSIADIQKYAKSLDLASKLNHYSNYKDGKYFITDCIDVWKTCNGYEFYTIADPEITSRLPYLGIVTGLSFSPDGKKLVATSTSYTAQTLVWTMIKDGLVDIKPELYRMEKCNKLEAIHSIKATMSNDSQWLAIGCNDSSVLVYNLNQPGATPEYNLFGRIKSTKTIRVSHYSSSVNLTLTEYSIISVNGASNPIASVINYKDAPVPSIMNGHTGPVVNLLIAPHNQTLITIGGDSQDSQGLTISGDGLLKIWDVANGTNLYSIPVNANSGLLAIHPQNSLIASAYENNTIRLWDIQQKSYAVDPLTLDQPNFNLSPDGKWLAFKQDCDTDTTFINLSGNDPLSTPYKLADGEANDSFAQNCGSFPDRRIMDFSFDGKWFTSANSDQVWDISQGITAEAKPVAGTETIRDNFYQNVSEFSPDGKWLLTGNSASVIYVMQVETGKLNNLPSPDSDVTLYGARNIERRYAFSPDGQWLARALPKSTKIELLDLQGTPILKEKGSLALPKGVSVEYLDFSPDNRWLIAHTEAGSFLLWDMTAADPNKTLITLEGFSGLAEAHFSQSGRWLAVYPLPDVAAPVQAGSVSLFDMNQMSASVKPIQLPLADTGDVHLVISQDEKWLAAVGRTGDAQLWDFTQTDFAKNPTIIPGLGNQVTDIAISLDGSLLAAGTNTGKMLLWKIDELLAGNTPLILSGGSKAFDHIEFTPDGRWLIGAGPEQPILIWHVQFDEVLALACETIGRNLTRAEWAQYGFTDEYRATCLQWPVEAETTSTP